MHSLTKRNHTITNILHAHQPQFKTCNGQGFSSRNLTAIKRCRYAPPTLLLYYLTRVEDTESVFTIIPAIHTTSYVARNIEK